MLNDSIREFIKKYFQSFTYFYNRLRYRIFVRMALSIGVGMMDAFGLAMFLPLLEMAGDDESTSQTSESMGSLDFLVEGMQKIGLELNLLTVLSVMSIFFILKGLLQYINGIYGVKLKQFFVKSLRVDLSKGLMQMSYKEFVTSDAGRIQNTMSGEVNRVSRAYEEYFFAFQQIVMVVVYMLFAFFVDAQFALLICIGGGLTNFLFKKIFTATKAASKKITEGSNSYQGLILQFVTNFKYLKATGFIKEYNKKLIDGIHYIERNNYKVGKLSTVVNAIREPILIIIVSLVILVQVRFLDGSLGSILLSLLFFYRALTALMFMQTAYNNFLSVSGSLSNMTIFENELVKAREKVGKEAINKFTTNLELKDVSFKYANNIILQNINLIIPKNQTVAFVGESGSGKTTLVNILAGLMPVDSGAMLIDGMNSRNLNLPSFQRRIGYITQEPVVFNDTIFNNVTFWAPQNPKNYQRFKKALERASINDFVDELPKKENTLLGNNGVNLSGGQKQRISIARELYKDVDILVLDEATSALDSETESAIQKGFENLQGEYTILIVAHRLATIKNADRIIVMNRGEIVGEGTFEELTLHSPSFKKMVSLQEV